MHGDLTASILEGFYAVFNELGAGFLEKVYGKALRIELEKAGLNVAAQMPIKVFYKGQMVGEYFADLCVDEKVIVELKASEKLTDAHEAQLVNYLRATEMEVGLLLNFGPKPSFVRKVCAEGSNR